MSEIDKVYLSFLKELRRVSTETSLSLKKYVKMAIGNKSRNYG